MNEYYGESFLDKLYKDLYNSLGVQSARDKSDKKLESIRKYLVRLEKFHSLPEDDIRKKYLYQFYFQKYLAEDTKIPPRALKIIQDEQKKGIIAWLTYLSDPTTSYPSWAKYWAFQGMLKIGTYDEGKDVFLKRSKKTLAPFVEANPEIIAHCIETIIKLVKGEEISPELAAKVSKNDSFTKIYTVFYKQYKKNVVKKSDVTDGKWIKYEQGDKKQAIKLYKSLQKKNTGWCTASESMAISQVCGPCSDAPRGGDFYVYYTRDENRRYKIPRIAIRLKGHDKIGEIRGVLEGQNLESSMEPILELKLSEMTFLDKTDVQINIRRCKRLRLLSRINKKTEAGEDLTEVETFALYYCKFGFGWDQDPRVDEIMRKRNFMEDFNSLSDDCKLKLLKAGYYQRFSPKSIGRKALFIRAINETSLSLEYATDRLRRDKEVVLHAVKKEGSNIEYAAKTLKGDKEIAEIAINSNSPVLKFMSKELQNDKDFILKAIKKNPKNYKFVSDTLKKDRDVVFTAILYYPDNLSLAPEEMRSDEKLLLMLANKHLLTYRLIPEELLTNLDFYLKFLEIDFSKAADSLTYFKFSGDVVLKLISKNPKLFRNVSYIFKNDKDFMLEALKIDGNFYIAAGETIKKDHDVIIQAIKHGLPPEQVSSKIIKTPDFLDLAFKNDVALLKYAPPEMQKDPVIVLKSVKIDGLVLKDALDEFRSDTYIVMEAVKQNGNAYLYAKGKARASKEIIEVALRNTYPGVNILSNIPDSYKNDPEYILSLVRINGLALSYASDDVKNNPRVVLEAIKNNLEASRFASYRLKNDEDFHDKVQEIKESKKNHKK